MKALDAIWNDLEGSVDYPDLLKKAEILSLVYQNSPRCDTIGGLPAGFLESITIHEIQEIAEGMHYLPTFEMSPEFDEPFKGNPITRDVFFEAANLSLIGELVWERSYVKKKRDFL